MDQRFYSVIKGF